MTGSPEGADPPPEASSGRQAAAEVTAAEVMAAEVTAADVMALDASAAPARRARVPRKPKAASQRRTRAIAVYATDVQEALLKARAREGDLTLSSYLLRRGLDGQVVARADWQRIAARLGAVEARLEAMARDAGEGLAPMDGLRVATALLALERAVRGLALPWQREIAAAAGALDLDVFWSPEAGEGDVALADDAADLALDLAGPGPSEGAAWGEDGIAASRLRPAVEPGPDDGGERVLAGKGAGAVAGEDASAGMGSEGDDGEGASAGTGSEGDDGEGPPC